MPHAREIHRELLRADRRELWLQMDGEYLRAIETGGKATAVAAKKQKLRDAPAHPAIERAKTIDELKPLTLAKLSE
jgi:hypothetical protein